MQFGALFGVVPVLTCGEVVGVDDRVLPRVARPELEPPPALLPHGAYVHLVRLLGRVLAAVVDHLRGHEVEHDVGVLHARAAAAEPSRLNVGCRAGT